ncbi:MAG TPA: SDR family oxidoreductase [Candidatus Dormibacteraeota bacterium]|jgi:3-oxoacyl-[acyl-carrier protein] reductase
MSGVLITGAGRRAGIAAACALKLARSGWDVGLSCWRAYDRVTGPASADSEPLDLLKELRAMGVRAELVEADLSDPAAPARLFNDLEHRLGPFSALVAAHCRDIELQFVDTSAEELDLHFAVNARSVALLIQELARRLPRDDGRVVAFTSDALAANVPYGVSKGALDRVIKAAAIELGPRGIRANCINPGPNETGWISAELHTEISRRSPLGRPSLPQDSADLVAFLLSPEGGWISGQVLHSNGGLQ